MKQIEKIVIGMIVGLFVLIVIIATDFWFLWLPLTHSSEYPQKVAALFMALTALVTLLVVYATFNATKQSNLREQGRREDEIEKDKRDKDERLLNEIIEWATDVRKYDSVTHIIDHPSKDFMMSADRYFTLKYNGKKFLIAAKKQAIGDDLQSLLSNAIEFFDNNWRDFATKRSRLEEIGKGFDKIGETIIEKAEDLLSSDS